jgi:glycogen operon protein
MIDDDFLILVNAWWEPLRFTIPATRASQAAPGQSWQAEMDTYQPAAPGRTPVVNAGGQLTVGPRSLIVCRARS